MGNKHCDCKIGFNCLPPPHTHTHFWNLYCNTALLLKPCLTHCSAVDPCYIKRQRRVCFACDPKNMQVLLVWKAPCDTVNLGFGHALIWTHGDNMHTQNREGTTDIYAQTVQRGAVVSVIITLSEQDVLCGVKRQNLLF